MRASRCAPRPSLPDPFSLRPSLPDPFSLARSRRVRSVRPRAQPLPLCTVHLRVLPQPQAGLSRAGLHPGRRHGARCVPRPLHRALHRALPRCTAPYCAAPVRRQDAADHLGALDAAATKPREQARLRERNRHLAHVARPQLEGRGAPAWGAIEATRPPTAPEARPLALACPVGQCCESPYCLDAKDGLQWRHRTCTQSPIAPTL